MKSLCDWFVAEEEQGVEAEVASAKDVDAAELPAVTFKSVLELLDALPETIANFVKFWRYMDARSFEGRAVGRCRHGREKGGANPVRELKHGVVFAMTEKRQLGQIMVSRAMRAEVPGEKAVGDRDVFNLVTAVKYDHALILLFHQLVFKCLRQSLNRGRVYTCAFELRTRLLDVDSCGKLNAMPFKERKHLEQESHGVASAVPETLAECTVETRPFDFNFQPIVPMCCALCVGGEIGLFKMYDFPGDTLKIALVKHQCAQQEDRLAVPFRRIKRSGIARFVNIAHQHFGSPHKNICGNIFRCRRRTRRLNQARHRFSNCAYSTKSQDGAQGGGGIANMVRNREMKGCWR